MSRFGTMSLLFLFLGSLFARTLAFGQRQVPLTTQAATTASAANAQMTAARKPTSNDGMQYVSENGSDSNDGLSWGTAKASIY